MDTVHNPDRYIANLRQILSQGRKRIGLLVGAGAPMSILVDDAGEIDPNGHPLIPGVEKLTEIVLGGIKSPELRSAAEALRTDLGSTCNIETILSAARLKAGALGNVEVYGLDGTGYLRLCNEICSRISLIASQSLPTGRTPYDDILAWVKGTTRSHSVEIFTTNYDLLFEGAFERGHAPYFDGFSGGAVPFFDPVSVSSDDLPPRWSRLWKLHGSLGWYLRNGSVVRGRNNEEAQLIYPDHLKYDLTQKQPYTALFERLRTFIRTPDTLILSIGFSFRDPHITMVIDEALTSNLNASLFAFQFLSLEQELPACELAKNRPNLSIYASDGAVINGLAGKWQPGELPKNWQAIRDSFWGSRTPKGPPHFLLGDFAEFARFCAVTQANDFAIPPDPLTPTPAVAAAST